MYDTLLENHAKLRADLHLPELRPAWLETDPRQPPPAADLAAWQAWLRAEIQAFGPVEGWLALEDGLLAFPADGLPGAGRTILYGELAGDGGSLHIRPDGAGGWRCTVWRESAAEPAGGGAEPCLAATETLLGTDRAPGDLEYRVFWRREPGRGLRRFAARFRAFVHSKES